MDSFGPQLKKIREQRGITLDEVSMSTKIGVRFLHALTLRETAERFPSIQDVNAAMPTSKIAP